MVSFRPLRLCHSERACVIPSAARNLSIFASAYAKATARQVRLREDYGGQAGQAPGEIL
jgi:hypothetical protein